MNVICNYNVCMPTKKGDWTGTKNPRWNGGKSRLTSGYVLVRCIGHPYAHKRTGYVLEHRLVMESAIGRYLLPGEEVHHKNGKRDDNRIENLELTVAGEHQAKYHSEKGKPVAYRIRTFVRCTECKRTDVKPSTIYLCHNCYMKQWNRKRGKVKSV